MAAASRASPTWPACFYYLGDVGANDRKGIALNQDARKITRGQTDDRVVPRICEQLSLDTFHRVIQPETCPLPQP